MNGYALLMDAVWKDVAHMSKTCSRLSATQSSSSSPTNAVQSVPMTPPIVGPWYAAFASTP
eukprot:SAG22_NODE_20058_length_269_cov_0.605882_1_plen_60_part_10